MLAFFVHVERWPEEEAANFNRRRMRAIATLARQQGTWGMDHARRCVSWAEHVQRDRNNRSLVAQLYKWRDAQWLQTRRLDGDTGGTNRPGTRRFSGHVAPRWDECVDNARNDIQSPT